MEPETVRRERSAAPIVGWSRPSASLASGLASPVPSDDTVVEELLSSYAEHNNNAPFAEVKFDVPADDSLITGSASSVYEGDDEEDQVEGRKIPDGGWGWVIVACSLVISLIADGISYTFGIFFNSLLDHFKETRAITSWIGSLFLAVPLLSGPVCSALVDRFGCRSMTIAGAIISCIGFVLSSIAPNIQVMYLTFGVIAGLGLGLCYVTAVVSIAFWFDKKRSLANGLGACGSGMGTFLYAPFTEFLIEKYEWQGAMLILGGTLFNMAVCGALMREPEWVTKENRGSSLATKSRGGSSRNSVLGNLESNFPGVEELRKMLQSSDAPHLVPICVATLGRNSIPNGDLLSPSYQSVLNLPTFIRHNEKVPVEVMESLKTNAPVYNAIVENYPDLALSRSFSDRTLSGSRSAPPTEPGSPVTKPSERVAPHSPLLIGSPKTHKPVRQSSMPGYLRNIRVRRNSVMYRGAMLNIKKYRLKASSCPDIFKNSMTTLAKENQLTWRKEAMDLCRDMADFSMFLDFHFLLVSVATMLVYTCYIVPYFFLPAYMESDDMYKSQDSSTALAVIGVTTTIGMVALGWLGDQPWVSVSKTFSVCLLGTGLMTIAIPIFMDNYYALMVACGGFGLFFSSVYSFTPPLIVQIIPLDRFTTAYGLSLLCQGIGNLVGPPIAGWIYDKLRSWSLAFYLAGVGLIISCLLVAIIPYTENRRITFSTKPQES